MSSNIIIDPSTSVTGTPAPPPAIPKTARPQYASFVLTASNTVQYAFLQLAKNIGRKFILFPGVNQTGGGPLSTNAANISVGIAGDGPLITPFTIQPGLPAYTVELPIGENEVTPLNAFICYGTNGDGFTILYWA